MSFLPLSVQVGCTSGLSTPPFKSPILKDNDIGIDGKNEEETVYDPIAEQKELERKARNREYRKRLKEKKKIAEELLKLRTAYVDIPLGSTLEGGEHEKQFYIGNNNNSSNNQHIDDTCTVYTTDLIDHSTMNIGMRCKLTDAEECNNQQLTASINAENITATSSSDQVKDEGNASIA